MLSMFGLCLPFPLRRRSGRVPGMRARDACPYGVAARFCLSFWGGRAAIPKRHLLLRAKRVLKGMGLIGKKGKTVGVPLLVRSAAAQAAIQSVMHGHIRCCAATLFPWVRNARPYG